jgi:hypothetical protein
MKCEYYECDDCGTSKLSREEDEVFPIVVDLEKYTDAAGSTDTKFQIVDLCGECIARWLSLILNRLDLDARQVFLKQITGRRKK